MIDAILFDMEGTLEDIFTDESSINASAEGVLSILRSHGIELPYETVSTTCNKLSAGWDRYSEYRSHAIEMLKCLYDMGLKLGIISNTGSFFQVFSTLNEYGIREFFNNIILSSITGYRKPHPNTFKLYLLQVKSQPQKTVYVGDTLSRDIIEATKMGFAATFYIKSKLTKIKNANITNDIKATYEIDDIYDVYTIMKDLLNKKIYKFCIFYYINKTK